MLVIRLVFMLLMVGAIACVAAYMATGQVVWRQRGLLIVKWTVLAGLAGEGLAAALRGLFTGPLGSDPFKGLGKISALGIKVSRHCTYHGLALNVAMDLEPFRRINPCGYEGLETTSLDKLGVSTDWPSAAGRLAERLAAQLTP